jgi:hypothetical protein
LRHFPVWPRFRLPWPELWLSAMPDKPLPDKLNTNLP